MLVRSQVTADGITTGRFYEVKCFTKDEMIREKTFPINNI